MQILNERQNAKGIMPSGVSKMQQKVICHNKGPARVIAGPGSGKTFTIIQRIKYLIVQNNVPPEQILCITFTKAAALEMKERYQKQIKGPDDLGNVCFGTVHSICYHILKESGEFRHYSLIQEQQKRKILEILLTDMGLKDYTNDTEISEILYAFGRKKNELPYREEEVLPVWQLEKIYKDYQQILAERQLLDFDDMINSALTVLMDNERLKNKWQNQFSYMMVDEFQDINQAQYQFIKILAEPQNNLLVVGDDDQAIYGFRGAAPNIMKLFADDFPMAEYLYLTENYRSRKNIVTFSEKIIQKNKNRFPKNIIAAKQDGMVCINYEETRKEEEKRLLQDIGRLSKELLYQSAIIVRTNIEAMQYIRFLKTHQIPVKYHEFKLQKNNKEQFIRTDFDAFLRFCKEGQKRSDFLIVMNKPELFLSRQALVSDIVKQEDLLNYYKENQNMQTKIIQYFAHIKKAKGMSFSMAISYFRNIIGYDRYLKEHAVNQKEYESFIQTADELQRLYKQQKNKESCDAFGIRVNQECVLQSEDGKLQDGIAVITMHGAKGLEFQHVFLPDINEGVIPAKKCKSKESMEEERRLLYVAVTRAKEAIHIYYTGERGRKISRFIKEIN